MTAKERYAADPEYRELILAYNRKRWAENKEKYAVRRKQYNIDHRAEKAVSNRQWREKNNELHKANARKWHADNHERSCENKRKWYLDNKERMNALNRQWYLDNKKQVAEYKRKWITNNRDKHRASWHARRERIRGVESCDKKSLNVLQQMIASVAKMKCGICGKNMPKADRTIDHIIPLVRGGTGNIGNLQVVHKSCNSRKTYKMPHEYTGQYEINFAGNEAISNNIRKELCDYSPTYEEESIGRTLPRTMSAINKNN